MDRQRKQREMVLSKTEYGVLETHRLTQLNNNGFMNIISVNSQSSRIIYLPSEFFNTVFLVFYSFISAR